jgi:fructose-1,6-bisphosphatase/inositol monophosphatase family enzyme
MVFSMQDALALDEMLRDAARSEILPRFKRLSTGAVRQKSSGLDLVTEVIAGLIHDPIGDDTAIAIRGEGAWIQAPDGRQVALKVSAPPASLGEASACVLWHFLPDDIRPVVTANLSRIGQAVCHYCAAHEFRMLAGGHSHFLFYSKLMPWDIAAGWLLHREAGGYAARTDGTPYRPASSEGWLIGAPDEASWHLFRAALFAR